MNDNLSESGRLPMKVLTYSTIYPNAAQPRLGLFVEQRLQSFLAVSGAQAKVVAPVPWFPSSSERFKTYGVFAKVPRSEVRQGLTVLHPRFPVIPKVGWRFSPALLYAGTRSLMRTIQREEFDFDIIDSHWLYPDGVAAVMLGRMLNRPVVMTARGNDVSLMPQYALPRAMILWAAKHSNAIVTVCRALKDSLLELGVPDEKVVVLRNGVDLVRFRPLDRKQARADLQLRGRTLVSVGLLIERKAHDITIEALSKLPDTSLMIIGEGPEEDNLRRLAQRLGVAERVRFVGGVDQDQLAKYYSAADAMVLSSSREGWANVLLESMACGTPVVASDVWGTPEVVASSHAGVLMRERTVAGAAEAIEKLFSNYPEHEQTRRYAEQFEWKEISLGQLSLFNDVIATHGRGRVAEAL